MPVLQDQWTEDLLTFNFPAGSTASKYDGWSHYRNQVQNGCGGQKAVDLVYLDNDVTWLIEVKDYRQHARTKAIDLADEIALKVRDTLAGLISARYRANDLDERACAKSLLQAETLRVVCHLEQPARRSRLRPVAYEPDKLQLKLRTLIKWIDPHPLVVSRTSLRADMKWTVT
jgi:hypothetical protein